MSYIAIPPLVGLPNGHQIDSKVYQRRLISLYILNSYESVDKIRNIKLKEDDLLVSLDDSPISPCVPLETTYSHLPKEISPGVGGQIN